jgi:hypothetical protein
MTALIAFAFFLGTLSPFLLQQSKSVASAEIPAELTALSDVLGASADSLAASICHHDEDAPAGDHGGKHHGEQNCCLCQALANLLHALPPADGSILIAAGAPPARRVFRPSPCRSSAALCAPDFPVLPLPYLKSVPFSSEAQGLGYQSLFK